MFTKLEQRFWLKIEAGRGKTARECYRGLVELCGMAAFPYRTVARWGQAFCAGWQNATDQPRPGRPSATEAQVSSVASLLETDGGQIGSWPVRPDCPIRRSCFAPACFTLTMYLRDVVRCIGRNVVDCTSVDNVRTQVLFPLPVQLYVFGR
jgi:hypothetical protein